MTSLNRQQRLSVADVLPLLQQHAGQAFGEFLSPHELALLEAQPGINKGGLGQLLERVLSIPHSIDIHDLRDGELKTHKSSSVGLPLETVAVTQLRGCLDDLIDKVHFRDSRVGRKINRTIFVPVFREPTVVVHEWRYLPPVFVDLDDTMWHSVRAKLEDDFEAIADDTLYNLAHNDGDLHGTTSTGRYLQIRTKDSQPYSPILSSRLGRQVSNKNYAFYLTKEFIRAIHRISGFRYVP